MLYQIILASIVGGLLSLTGGVILLWRERYAKKVSLYFISFAAGSLLGAAFLEIIPEALVGIGELAFLYVIFGILTIFIFEKFLGWYHRHDHRHGEDTFEEHTFSAQAVIFGDALHNFVDGIAIALSFLISVEIGIATTIAVFLHEIPQEIGDFGVLIHRGYTKGKIIVYNLLTALTTVFGAILAFYFSSLISDEVIFYVLAIAAGTFIYISTSDLIPELRERGRGRFDIGHTIAIIFGVLTILLVSTFFPG